MHARQACIPKRNGQQNAPKGTRRGPIVAAGLQKGITGCHVLDFYGSSKKGLPQEVKCMTPSEANADQLGPNLDPSGDKMGTVGVSGPQNTSVVWHSVLYFIYNIVLDRVSDLVYQYIVYEGISRSGFQSCSCPYWNHFPHPYTHYPILMDYCVFP